MAFGKIVVQTEDGDIEEHELTKPTTSVGRQPGNDIVLPTTAVSRYHAQLDVAEGGVYLVDLGTVNGTFVNDRQLDANSRVLLSDGDVITLGDVALRFTAPEARSGSKRAALSFTPEARVIEAPGVPFRVVLEEPQQSVAPGARLQLTLTIENLADEQLPLVIELGGLDPDWVKTNRRDAMLEPQEQIQAMISVKPPRASETKPGVYALTVRVSSGDDPSLALEAVREIDVVAYSGLGVAMQRGRSGGQYHLAVQNQGNVPTSIQFEGYQRQRLLRFRFQPAHFSLGPGETWQVSLNVTPASGRPFGASQDVTFAVVAKSQDVAAYQAPVIGRYTISPSWPGWLLGAGVPMLLGAALVIFLLIAAGLVALGVIPLTLQSPTGVAPAPTSGGNAAPLPPTPTLIATAAGSINEFVAEQQQVPFATSGAVTLRWNTEGAQSVVLVGPGGDEIKLTAAEISTGRYEFPIANLALGANQFALTITGDDGQERTRYVTVIALAAACRLDPGTLVYAQPDPVSAPGPELRGEDVIVIGRTADSLWALIAYNDLSTLEDQGWVAADALACSSNSPPLAEYPVQDVVSHPPLPTGTP